MRVQLAPDVLDDPNAWIDLDRIVDALVDEASPDDERHLWEIEDLDAMLASAWLQPPEHRRSSLTRELAARSFLALATVPTGRKAHTLRVLVTHTTGAGTTLNLAPRRAVKVLREPLRIVVENNHSDGAFLETMAAVFARRDLIVAVARGWCVFVHAGGSGELFKRVEECLLDGCVAARVCVVTDGDRLSPRVPVDPRPARLRDECAARGVVCFVLHKRDIENYLPVQVLALGEAGEKLTSFSRLTQAQRDHFDMKDGFRNRPADDPAYGDLYAGLNATRRAALANGFGKEIGKLFVTKRPQFRRDEVEKTCATNQDELPTLLDALECML